MRCNPEERDKSIVRIADRRELGPPHRFVQSWNKAAVIWFPPVVGLPVWSLTRRSRQILRPGETPCSRRWRLHRFCLWLRSLGLVLRGKTVLTDRNEGGSGGSDGNGDGPRPLVPKNKRTPRSGDVGRALRSVYDETLREEVPDDFMNLLGKLS